MKNTNSYYGFTNSLTSMQKAKIEKQLDKRYCGDDNKVYRFVDFAINELFNNNHKVEKVIITKGMIPDKRYGGKCWGELPKPKTEYRLINKETSIYCDITKTQYDFCNYITETFKTMDEAMDYVEKEAERIRIEKEEKAKEEERIAKDEQIEREMQEEFKNWLRKEIHTYNNYNVIEMCETIFKHYFPESGFYGVSSVIICIDNINHEKYGKYCRNELVETLHNQNKASLKIFERYTDTKLPKTYKERIEFLKNFNNG